MKASIKNIVLPDAPAPTKAAYKKPVIYNNSKHMRVVELPCQYKPKPAPIPKRTPKPKPKKKLARGYKREVHQQPRFWTAEREQELAELYQEGTTIDQIAIYFDKAQSVISKRIEDMIDRGVIKRRRPLNAWPQEDLDLMYEMRMQGKTFGEIADRLGRVTLRMQRREDLRRLACLRDLRNRTDCGDRYGSGNHKRRQLKRPHRERQLPRGPRN